MSEYFVSSRAVAGKQNNFKGSNFNHKANKLFSKIIEDEIHG